MKICILVTIRLWFSVLFGLLSCWAGIFVDTTERLEGEKREREEEKKSGEETRKRREKRGDFFVRLKPLQDGRDVHLVCAGWRAIPPPLTSPLYNPPSVVSLLARRPLPVPSPHHCPLPLTEPLILRSPPFPSPLLPLSSLTLTHPSPDLPSPCPTLSLSSPHSSPLFSPSPTFPFPLIPFCPTPPLLLPSLPLTLPLPSPLPSPLPTPLPPTPYLWRAYISCLFLRANRGGRGRGGQDRARRHTRALIDVGFIGGPEGGDEGDPGWAAMARRRRDGQFPTSLME